MTTIDTDHGRAVTQRQATQLAMNGEDIWHVRAYTQHGTEESWFTGEDAAYAKVATYDENTDHVRVFDWATGEYA